MGKMKKAMVKAADELKRRTTGILRSSTGSGFIDQAIAILIAVVLGALLLAGLYALFGEVILPTLVDKIKAMFNYTG